MNETFTFSLTNGIEGRKIAVIVPLSNVQKRYIASTTASGSAGGSIRSTVVEVVEVIRGFIKPSAVLAQTLEPDPVAARRHD